MTEILEIPAGWQDDLRAVLRRLAHDVAQCPEPLRPLDQPGTIRVTVEYLPPANEDAHE